MKQLLLLFLLISGISLGQPNYITILPPVDSYDSLIEQQNCQQEQFDTGYVVYEPYSTLHALDNTLNYNYNISTVNANQKFINNNSTNVQLYTLDRSNINVTTSNNSYNVPNLITINNQMWSNNYAYKIYIISD
jgi:hypothetical protein